MRILDFLKTGTLVEIVGTPFAKGYIQDDQSVKAEIRLNVSKTNILRPAKDQEGSDYDEDEDASDNYNDEDDYTSSSANEKAVKELEADLF